MGNKKLDKKYLYGLIEQITPLNNRYRDLVKNIDSGKEILLVMWQAGEVIESFIKIHNIKPHTLYWQMYGKAEGLKTSYITRDFLSYCLRIKKYFSTSAEITTQYPFLKKYSLFREAFPLLENPKFKLSKIDENKIIRILNSGNSIKKTKKLILEIKAQRIGIKNTRRQKLIEMKPLTDNFIFIYNELYSLIKNNNQAALENFRKSIKDEYIKKLSQIVSALTQENLFIPEIEERSDLPSHWKIFVDNLKYLLTAQVEVRNRFRRLVVPRKIFNLADMLNAIIIDQGITSYKKRKNI